MVLKNDFWWGKWLPEKIFWRSSILVVNFSSLVSLGLAEWKRTQNWRPVFIFLVPEALSNVAQMAYWFWFISSVWLEERGLLILLCIEFLWCACAFSHVTSVSDYHFTYLSRLLFSLSKCLKIVMVQFVAFVHGF